MSPLNLRLLLPLRECVCVVFVGLCVFIRDSRARKLGFGMEQPQRENKRVKDMSKETF